MSAFRAAAIAVCCAAFLFGAGHAEAQDQDIVRTVPEVKGEAIAMYASRHTVFVADAAGNRVTEYDTNGPESNIRHYPVGPNPRYIALDTACNPDPCFYTSNAGDGTITVRRGSSFATLAIGGSGPILADAGRAYVLRMGASPGLTVIDGPTLGFYSVDIGPGRPTAFTRLASGRLAVAFENPNEVRVIDPTAPSPSAAAIVAGRRVPGRPAALGYSESTGKVYVVTDDAAASMLAIDHDTMAMQVISTPGVGRDGRAIAVSGNVVYAGFASGVVMYNARSGNLHTFQTAGVRSIVADGIGGEVYVLDDAGVVTSIRGLDLRTRTTRVALPSASIGFIYKTCNVVVAGPAGTTLVHSSCSDLGVGGIDAQGLWWAEAGAESGWGINVTHQGTTLFATWFTYDSQGRATWLVMSDGRDVGRNRYEGPLYRTTGPAFGGAFDPARVTRTPVGKLTFTVWDTDRADVVATVDGVTIRKSLSKQQFALPMPVCFVGGEPGSLPNYQDLWWNPSESGWGLNLAHQGDILFATWFTYDGSGQPMWFVGSNVAKTGNATYSGPVYRTAGPPAAASPWDPANVSRMPAGNVTLTFADANNGTFAYTVDGVTQAKAITRQVFATPASVCR